MNWWSATQLSMSQLKGRGRIGKVMHIHASMGIHPGVSLELWPICLWEIPDKFQLHATKHRFSYMRLQGYSA